MILGPIFTVLSRINVKNEVYKTVRGDVIAHLKPKKNQLSSDL